MKEDYEWVLACMVSCTNKWQLEASRNMIRLFNDKHQNKKHTDRLLEEYLVLATKFLACKA